MRYNFFAPLPPLFSLSGTPEEGWNGLFSPLKIPSSPAVIHLFPASLAYTIYRGELRSCGGGDANHYWSALGPVVVTHIDQ